MTEETYSGYVVTYTVDGASAASVANLELTDDCDIVVTNTKDGNVDTGIHTSSTAEWFMLLLMFGGLIAFMMRKRITAR